MTWIDVVLLVAFVVVLWGLVVTLLISVLGGVRGRRFADATVGTSRSRGAADAVEGLHER